MYKEWDLEYTIITNLPSEIYGKLTLWETII